MNPRIFFAVALLLLASPLASAGVIVFEADAPVAQETGFAMAADESADLPAVEYREGQGTSMAVSTPTSVLVFAAITSDSATVPSSQRVSERIEIGNSKLPPTPLLDHLLKPS